MMTWNITEGRCHLPIIVPTSKSSPGGVRTLSFVDHSANSKRTILIVRRTLPWKSTARSRNASSTRRRCGRRDHATRQESGNIGDQDVTRIRVLLEDFTFTCRIILTNVSMLVRNSTSEFSRIIGFIMERSCAHRARSYVVNSLP